jgi:hypothetical protein
MLSRFANRVIAFFRRHFSNRSFTYGKIRNFARSTLNNIFSI